MFHQLALQPGHTRDITALAHADPSAAWIAAVTASMSRFATFLPEPAQHRLWDDDPDTLIAGTLRPQGTAHATPHGWTLSGEWPYVSAAHHARWALLACRLPTDEHPGPVDHFALIPATAWTVHPTWDATGLRATGSHTLRLDDVHISRDDVFIAARLFTGHARTKVTVPHEAVSGLTFAAPLLGAAEAMLDHRIARLRETGTDPTPHADALGTASTHLKAARLLLLDAAERTPMDPVTAVRARRDHAAAATHALAGVDLMWRDAGTTASQRGTFSRLWRDAHTAGVHPALATGPAHRAWIDVHTR
ncbi:hydrolase [Embleya sp. NPDC008237]|uniref:hydrolase n=1 Tax=Embleya sp. NPDC008237 TaxID=3363978 RepID=UPI0036E3F4A5